MRFGGWSGAGVVTIAEISHGERRHGRLSILYENPPK
jgi:hypothetical protein